MYDINIITQHGSGWVMLCTRSAQITEVTDSQCSRSVQRHYWVQQTRTVYYPCMHPVKTFELTGRVQVTSLHASFGSPVSSPEPWILEHLPSNSRCWFLLTKDSQTAELEHHRKHFWTVFGRFYVWGWSCLLVRSRSAHEVFPQPSRPAGSSSSGVRLLSTLLIFDEVRAWRLHIIPLHWFDCEINERTLRLDYCDARLQLVQKTSFGCLLGLELILRSSCQPTPPR